MRPGLSLKALDRNADWVDGVASMRIRALTSVVLVIAWIVPAVGMSCPSDEAAGHVHASAAEATPPHVHGDHDHANSHDADVPSSDDPSCCKRVPEPLPVHAVVKDVQPRPKLSPALLPTTLVLLAPPAVPPTEAQLRSQQPRPPPFARTRRPLLI